MVQPQDELSEKDFIHEDYGKNPFAFWVWVCIFVVGVAIFWGISAWYDDVIGEQLEKSPFLQVTNRELQVMLWEFPELLPRNVKEKTGYLPAFANTELLGVELEFADDFVQAPPEILFLYHTWKRLVYSEFSQRPIRRNQFEKFLSLLPEWSPENWPGAPKGYRELVKNLKGIQEKNLANYPDDVMPFIVRRAFQGWKNYFLEGDFIDKTVPTYEGMEKFIRANPNYARNYWRNVFIESYPNYLKTFTYERAEGSKPLSAGETPAFLKVAYYNYSTLTNPSL
jgi:hypothetical protein